MKKLSVIGLLILVACQPQEQTTTLSEEEKASVLEASQQYSEAILAGDLDKIDSVSDPEIILMPPGSPPVTGQEAAREFMSEGPEIQGTIEPDVVEGGGNFAFVRGNYSLTFIVNDTTEVTDEGKYIEIWRRQEDGSWKVYIDMWNSNTEPEPAMNMSVPEEEEM